MLIVICPACHARYTVPKPPPVRTRLKCRRCQDAILVPAEGAPPTGQPAPPEPPPPRGREDPRAGDQTIASGSLPSEQLDLSPGQRISLIVVEGANKGKQFSITKTWTTVGRREGDILLQDSEVSGTHAVLKVLGGVCRVQDLNSTNGTYVNGRRVDEAPVAHLDEIQLGRTRLSLCIVEEAELPPLPKRRLLIVTPQPALRDRLLSRVRSSEWDIRAVDSGREVPGAVEPEGHGPVALLLDLDLPAGERRDLASSLRGLTSTPPLLGVAGPWSMQELLVKLEGLDVMALVDQDWPAQRIVTAVERLLAPRGPGGIARTSFGRQVAYSVSGVQVRGTIGGLTPWGTIIQAEKPLPPHTEIPLLFTLPNIPRTFRVEGRVVARDRKEDRLKEGQMEVWFLNMDSAGRSQIAAFLFMAEIEGSLEKPKEN